MVIPLVIPLVILLHGRPHPLNITAVSLYGDTPGDPSLITAVLHIMLVVFGLSCSPRMMQHTS